VAAASTSLLQLPGKDSPTGAYACTVIDAADERSIDRRMTRVLYNRRSFTTLRCYS
jgi:hypothetical protein